MSFGKLFGHLQNPRSYTPLMLAKALGLDIELVETGKGVFSEEALTVLPHRKIPGFLGADGLKLHEAIAIALYFASQDENEALLGDSKAQYAEIVKWMSFANMELLPNLAKWVRPLLGMDSYNKKVVDQAEKDTNNLIEVVFEPYLAAHTYLVGEKFSLADLFTANLITRGFENVFGTAWKEAHPHTTRWYTLVTNQPIFTDVHGEPKLVEEPIKYTPPKKEAAPKKEAKKKEAAPKAAEEEEEKTAPKPKHPLAALGASKMELDAWKRTYSNEDTRPAALPWFWENYDPSEWSLWKVEYKYNDELTLTFMTANLIGGFFNRLSASTKYLFGCLVVYGENNNNGIIGAFLVRGQDYVPAFDVAPDWESYNFTKLDSSKPEDKAFVEDMWAWDKPVVVDGTPKEIVDGKVFK
ncbi:hypothetical protein V1511DRAFT_504174 [Dipodascopsis uninucleata]